VDGFKVTFEYDENIRTLNCREAIPSELRSLISAELPMPHGTRFNYFRSASEADLDIRRAIALNNYGNPNELVDFLTAIYGSIRYSNMAEVTVKGKVLRNRQGQWHLHPRRLPEFRGVLSYKPVSNHQGVCSTHCY
jgi:hypothetical protein